MGRFETEWLTRPPGELRRPRSARMVDAVHSGDRRGHRARHGFRARAPPTANGSSAYNGHFGCTCDHPLFVFNQLAIWSAAPTGPGTSIRHSADGWRKCWNRLFALSGRVKRLYFRAMRPRNPELRVAQGRRHGYANRLRQRVLQEKIGHLLKRPVGRPPQEVRRYIPASATRPDHGTSRAMGGQSCRAPGRALSAGRLHRHQLARTAERVGRLYNHRGTASSTSRKARRIK